MWSTSFSWVVTRFILPIQNLVIILLHSRPLTRPLLSRLLNTISLPARHSLRRIQLRRRVLCLVDQGVDAKDIGIRIVPFKLYL